MNHIIAIPGFSEPFSSISHLVGAAIALVASFFLVYRGRGNQTRVIGLLIYSFCLVFLLSMSGMYHLLERGFTANYVFKILDYTGIYGLIAGTFTPIHLILFRGLHRWMILSVVWVLAIIGLTLTAIYFETIPQWLNVSFFLGLGWVGAFSMWKIYQVHSKALLGYLLLGGLLYSIGAVIEFLGQPILWYGVIESHDVFHVFVLMAALCHWKLVYQIAKYPVSAEIVILVTEFPGNVFVGKATSEHKIFNSSSAEQLKKEVLRWVETDFHKDMRPNYIRFKFSQEELIPLL
jgi:channel protein (hemolysin III family)